MHQDPEPDASKFIESDEPKVSQQWGKFVRKISLALVWLLAATAVASFVSDPDPNQPKWLLPLAIVVGIAPVLQIYLSAFRMKRLDEREQKLAFQTLLMGNAYALVFGCLTWLWAVWESSKSDDFSNFDPISIIVLPPLGYLFSAMSDQFEQWLEVRGGTKRKSP